ncbi:MAG: hypothetical protein ACLQFR_22725 [Streptosporangiaceae bacterium]
MADIYALVSAGGAPGVTTAALALALSWPSPVILAECDPSGGDILAGLLGGQVPARQGLTEHAIEAGRGPETTDSILASQLIPLDTEHRKLLLPGMTDPRQATGLGSGWSAIAATLAGQHADVIADCGRLDSGEGQPLPVLLIARIVTVVLRPTLRQVWAVRSRIDILTRLLGGTERLLLLLTGPGPYSDNEIQSALGVEVSGRLPADSRAAAALSDGAAGYGKLITGRLVRAAGQAGLGLRGHENGAASHTAEAGARL